MKDLIDRYFSRNYQKLVCIAQSLCNDLNRTYKGESVVSNVYMLVLEKPPREKEDIPRYVTGLIKKEIFYTNSTTAREEECRMIEATNIRISGTNNVDEHIHLMDFYDSYNAFRDNLNAQERIVCDVYFLKGKKTIRELSEHFNIAKSSLYDHIYDTLLKIKEFEYESKKGI